MITISRMASFRGTEEYHLDIAVINGFTETTEKLVDKGRRKNLLKPFEQLAGFLDIRDAHSTEHIDEETAEFVFTTEMGEDEVLHSLLIFLFALIGFLESREIGLFAEFPPLVDEINWLTHEIMLHIQSAIMSANRKTRKIAIPSPTAIRRILGPEGPDGNGEAD